MTPPRPRTLAAAVLLVASAALVGCSAETTTTRAAAPGASPTAFDQPVEVENCGRTLRFERPPTRIVSGWPTSTELLLELGVGDRLVGQYNTGTGTPSPDKAAAYAQVPVLAEQAPSREVLLQARPDLIWADGEYLFDGKTLPTIADLAEDGVQVLVLSGFCGDDATRATITDVRGDVETLGRVLGLDDRATKVRDDVDRRLAAVAARVKGAAPVPVLFLSTYDKALYTYEGVYSDLATRAGARNLYAGKLPGGAYFGQVSTEAVLALDPPTIVYLASAGQTRDAALAEVRRLLPTVRAVRDGKVVVLPQNDSTNLRGVAGVEALAEALHP